MDPSAFLSAIMEHIGMDRNVSINAKLELLICKPIHVPIQYQMTPSIIGVKRKRLLFQLAYSQ